MSKNVGQYILERLVQWGIRRVFGYPESAHWMARSGSRGESSHETRWGFTGLASG